MAPFTFGSSDAKIYIINGTSSNITITGIYFVWPVENGPLEEIKLSSPKIWVGDANSPANIISGWTGESRTVLAGDSDELRLKYDHSDTETNHSIWVTFGNGCVASRSN